MPVSAQLRAVADSLDVYHMQLSALSHALTALRVVSDDMLAAVERDRATLSALLAEATAQLPAQTIEAAAATAADADTPDCAADTSLTLEPAPLLADEAPAAPVDLENAAEAAKEYEPAPEMLDDTQADRSVETMPPVAEEAADLAAGTTGTVTPQAEPTSLAVEADTASTIVAFPPAEVAAPDVAHAAAVSVTPSVAETAGEQPAVTSHPASSEGEAKILDLAAEREVRAARDPARRRALALVASLAVVTTMTLGMHELLGTELGQRLLDLGSCDGDMLSANRDCTLLSWLML